MNRHLCIRVALLGLAFVTIPAAWGQTPINVSFRVYTQPAGGQFSVDGQIYTSTATFVWPEGSQHFVSFVNQSTNAPNLPAGSPTLAPAQYTPDGATQYTFTSWVDNAGLLPSKAQSDPNQLVTASTAFTSLRANLTISYRVLLNFSDYPSNSLPSSCGGPGTAPTDVIRGGIVYLAQACYWNNAIVYLVANSQVTLSAIPFPGFVFLGWTSNLGSNTSNTTFTLAGPITLGPRFVPAKRVRFVTQPLGLQVLVDRTVTPTVSSEDPSVPCPENSLPFSVPVTFLPLCRGDFDFVPNSTHVVGAPTPQIDLQGKTWVFDSWGNGQGQNAVYTADDRTANSDRIVVHFVPGATVSFVTSPPGLKLTVDGRQNWPSYNFVWGLGTSHQVAAAAQQVDSAGRQYTFQGWSNSGPAAQNLTVDQIAVDSGFRITARYSVLSRLTIQSTPSGQKVQVDGTDCQTPCVLDRPAGSQVRVTAPTSILVSDSLRLDLNAWSDGGTADHLYTLNSDTQSLGLTYATSYRLTTAVDPANGASFRFDPSSPDLFYTADSQVSISVDSKPGFKFRRWGGDLTGTYPQALLAMSAPRSILALMDRIPYIAPAGIKNAAGDTPASTVAPGSLIAITGESLAPDTMQGRVNPLAQTIDGITVTIGDRLLPLVSVSPQAVVAQLPSGLADGTYTLQVHSLSQPDVSGDFSVGRNSPGLFSSLIGSDPTAYAMAFHADGTAVSPASPASVGETITIQGTGFGPYATTVIDGFFPSTPSPALLDPVDVLLADQVYPAIFCGAAQGITGIVAVQLKITGDMPSGMGASLKVRVNGVVSNTVTLPLQ